MKTLEQRGQVVAAELLGGDTPGPILGIPPRRDLGAVQVFPGSRIERVEPYRPICCGAKHMGVMLARVGAQVGPTSFPIAR